MITDQRTCSTGHIVAAWLITAFLLGYTLPWAIAAQRGKATVGVIAAVNVTLGWLIVPWWIALFMALTPHRILAVQQRPQPLYLTEQQLRALPPPR